MQTFQDTVIDFQLDGKVYGSVMYKTCRKCQNALNLKGLVIKQPENMPFSYLHLTKCTIYSIVIPANQYVSFNLTNYTNKIFLIKHTQAKVEYNVFVYDFAICFATMSSRRVEDLKDMTYQTIRNFRSISKIHA